MTQTQRLEMEHFTLVLDFFYQHYTLHGYVEDTSYPLVFALLPNKIEQTYARLFLLKGDLLQNNLFLTPQLVLMDFETAARNALKAVFPQLILKACFFHLTQCIWRKSQACGLAGQYRQDGNIKTLVRRSAVLPLVPVNEVEDMWFHALENNDNDTPEVTRFADYVTDQWVEG